MDSFEPLNRAEPDTRPWIHVPGDWRRPHVQENYTVYWSPHKYYGQVLPRPRVEDIPEFYAVDTYYTHHTDNQESHSDLSLPWRALVHLAWRCDQGVEPSLEWWSRELGDKPKRILEMGCGNGDNLALLATLGHRVEGVEPDPNARAVAKQAGLKLYAGTAEEPPKELQQESYDVVIMMHVLEHCLDPVTAIANAKLLLAPGGKLIIEVPNNACIGAEQFGACWHWLDVPRHLNFFTEQSLRQLLQSQGLGVTQVNYRGYTRQFLADWVATQSHIAQALGCRAATWRHYFGYFLKTAKSSPARKYDSVRISSSKPA